jgi:hypothetical protein
VPPFSPRRLDPVLDRGVGDEDAVVAPQVPGREAVGQAVFDHEPDGQGDDAPGVVAARGRQIGEVGTEVQGAGFTAVFGVGDVENPRAVPPQAADLVEDAPAAAVPVATAAALRASPTPVTAGAGFDQRLGKVLDTGMAHANKSAT